MKPYSETALLQAAQELIAIPSTVDNPDGLRAAYNYVLDMVRSCGKAITVEEFESGGEPSFLAYKSGPRPETFHIILNGHLDVVPGTPEQYKPYIKDDKLYGRGAYDMKAAAIALAAMFCEYVDKVPYPLALQIVTDEEHSGHDGTKYQVQQGVRGDFVICGDCGRTPDVYEIANEAKGTAFVVVGFDGTSSHGAYPWNADNPIAKAAHFAQELHERYPTPLEATGETTFAITGINADSGALTKIPNLATVNIDARFVAGDPNFRSEAGFIALIKSIDPDARIIKFHDFSAPIYTRPDNPLLLSLKASAEMIEGAEFSFARRNGTSDGRFYGSVGNQACEFGIAGENQHTENEYITLQAFRNYLATMRDFLEKTIATEGDKRHQ
ncbi:MAG TPA: M20/M25/M40 family metallo-hydrolase [Candidatus Saccharimonadia bacterium]|nr:M20/M25/M40 family metallo-hydrolase [Candidatus Saccharimonadia bacterium]